MQQLLQKRRIRFHQNVKRSSLPKIDYETFLDIHRKNIEAMQTSAAVVSEGGRAVLAKQQEILAEVGREAQQLIADFKPGGSPQEVAAKQAELAKRVFEATAKNTRDVVELIQKSNSETFRIILDRMREGFAEARVATESRKAWYATSAAYGRLARTGFAATREILAGPASGTRVMTSH
jgi:phasin family protein